MMTLLAVQSMSDETYLYLRHHTKNTWSGSGMPNQTLYPNL